MTTIKEKEKMYTTFTPNQNTTPKKEQRRRKQNCKKRNLNIFYANANGPRSQINSLQAGSNLQESHIITISEIKGQPSLMDG